MTLANSGLESDTVSDLGGPTAALRFIHLRQQGVEALNRAAAEARAALAKAQTEAAEALNEAEAEAGAERDCVAPLKRAIDLLDGLAAMFPPVLAWLAEQVEIRPIVDASPRVTTRIAYSCFREWSIAEGFSDRTLPSINAFVQRITANAAGIEYRRSGEGRFFLGMVLRRM